MSHESEHEDMHDQHSLHDALDAEVAGLEIGATPVAAVLAGGTALRTRRRLTAVSGVAALAVLPVAAVAIFAGRAGSGTGTGGTANGAVKFFDGNHEGNHAGTSKPTTANDPTVPVVPEVPTARVPSPTLTLPPQGRGLIYEDPVANDSYTVLAGGTIGGQHWRLVRDLFVVPSYANPGLGGTNHLPMSQRGKAGTQACDFTGLQWGDRPAGTLPDFGAGGGCNPAVDGDIERVTAPLMGAATSGTPTRDLPLSYFYGRVDASKVASVTVTIGSRSTSPQTIYTVPGETDGYYVVFVPPLTFQDEQYMVITAYDAGGKAVGHLNMSLQKPAAH